MPDVVPNPKGRDLRNGSRHCQAAAAPALVGQLQLLSEILVHLRTNSLNEWASLPPVFSPS
jgi:hypothetical protein